MHLGISYVESSNANGIFEEREEVDVPCAVEYSFIVSSFLLPQFSPSVFPLPLCDFFISLMAPQSAVCSALRFWHVWITEETICTVVTSMIFNRWSIMVYETKLPRQASTSTVTEDCNENSEVSLRRGRGLEHQPLSTQDRRQWLSSSGAELSQSGKDPGLLVSEVLWRKDGGWVTRVNNYNEGWGEDTLEENRREITPFHLLHDIRLLKEWQAA